MQRAAGIGYKYPVMIHLLAEYLGTQKFNVVNDILFMQINYCGINIEYIYIVDNLIYIFLNVLLR